MGVQKNIALLKTKNELVTENLQKLILAAIEDTEGPIDPKD